MLVDSKQVPFPLWEIDYIAETFQFKDFTNILVILPLLFLTFRFMFSMLVNLQPKIFTMNKSHFSKGVTFFYIIFQHEMHIFIILEH